MRADSVIPISAEIRSYASRIETAWRKSVEGVLEVGQVLCEAKDALPHGQWQTLVEGQCPFSMRTAQTLMQIASHAVLSNAQHAAHLPNSWSSLAELARWSPAELSHALRNYWIKPDIKREEIPAVWARTKKAMGSRGRPPKIPERTARNVQFASVLKSFLETDDLEWLQSLDDQSAATVAEHVSQTIHQLREDMADE